VRSFASEAQAFVDLLREHIAKEDEVLFPMADRMLPAAVHEELLLGFEHAERVEMGAGTHEKYLAVADRLAQRWGVTRAFARAKAHACSCSHGR
jgi:hemerythrin-like domain-containing protein